MCVFSRIRRTSSSCRTPTSTRSRRSICSRTGTMKGRARNATAALLAAALWLAAPAFSARADDPKPPPPLEGTKRWQKLTPEERQRIHERWQQFQKLPPDQQEQLRQKMKQFRSLPKEERARVRQNYQKWQQLTPGKRQQMREKYQRFQQLPPEQKQQVREKHQQRAKDKP